MRTTSAVGLVLTGIFLLSGVAAPQSASRGIACGNAPFVIRDVRIFDGEKMLGSADVYVGDTLISAVGKDISVPAGTRSCAATGFTLMPGLIDGHTHINDRTNLAEALLFGVTTELDMFAQVDTIQALRKSGVTAGGNTFADFRTAGTLVTTAGGHGTQFGFTIPTLQSPDSAQQFVDHRLAEGSNYIKVVYDNGTEWGFVGPMLDSATMSAAIAAAKKRGVLSIVHIGSYRGARVALEAGADALGHVFADSMPDPGFGEFVAAHNAFVITTLTPIGQLSTDSTWGMDRMLHDSSVMSKLDPGQDSSLGERLTPPARAHMQIAKAVVEQLRAAHVRVIAGSDSPAPGTAHGITLHLELRNMVRAGFTSLEALRAATSVPAQIFGLTDRGRIAPGLRSDLVLIDGDPISDINATFRIAGVWKRGRLVDRTHSPLQATLARATSLPVANVLGGFDRAVSVSGMVATNRVKDPEWRPIGTTSLSTSPDGAQGSMHALRVEGGKKGGVEFRPLKKIMAPPPFYGFTGVEFWTRGDRQAYTVTLELYDGTVTRSQVFTATTHWSAYKLAFTDFGVTAPGKVVAIRFTRVNSTDSFSFDLDQVRLW
jgi:imidazolonepropionase-like amidohydrolase